LPAEVPAADRLLPLLVLEAWEVVPPAGPIRPANGGEAWLCVRALPMLELLAPWPVHKAEEPHIRPKAFPVHADWCHMGPGHRLSRPL